MKIRFLSCVLPEVPADRLCFFFTVLFAFASVNDEVMADPQTDYKGITHGTVCPFTPLISLGF